MNPIEFHPFEMQFEVPDSDGQNPSCIQGDFRHRGA